MHKQGRGLLLVVSGPSGVGKGTVCQALHRQDSSICTSVSATTRQPRPGEIDGVNYHFISAAEFERLRDQNAFLEYAQVFGNYYGTLRADVDQLLDQGKSVILEIDVQGAMQVKASCPSGVFIFILPPSLEELRRRIVSRGSESDEARELRLSKAEKEMSLASAYDYSVVNDDLQQAVSELRQIIATEKVRRQAGMTEKENHLVK